MWRDWCPLCICPLCSKLFEAENREELANQILEHLEEKGGEKSECEKNWVSFGEALADDGYDAKQP